MKVIIIPECLDCPYILPVVPYNIKISKNKNSEHQAAYCKKYAKPIETLKQIPKWCKLEELDQNHDFEKEEGINWGTTIAWLGVFALIAFIVHTCVVNA